MITKMELLWISNTLIRAREREIIDTIKYIYFCSWYTWYSKCYPFNHRGIHNLKDLISTTMLKFHGNLKLEGLHTYCMPHIKHMFKSDLSRLRLQL